MAERAASVRDRAHVETIGDGAVVSGTDWPPPAAPGREPVAPGRPVAIVGVAHGLHPELRPGHLVVATELRAAADRTPPRLLPSAGIVANDLRRLGLEVRCGPLVSLVTEPSAVQRAELGAGGAIAWDTASARLAQELPDRPLAVVRVVVDAEDAVPAIPRSWALGPLLGARPSLDRWARAARSYQVLLAGPRSFCAGVERAIQIVERALEQFGRPVYVRRQIVHNAHVVSSLEAKGAVFVTELDEVPDSATVVLAAHGVSPAVRATATARPDLRVIDATCPLVAKVHHEARRFLAQDYRVVLIGHAHHEEVLGTLGEAPDRIRLVEQRADVARLPFAEEDRVAYLTQTTLALDETADVVQALRERFPRLAGPHTDDICYATQNRQDAVRALAPHCDLLLVVGSTNSSNTARLVEVARREGCRAERIEDASELWLGWLDGASRIGLTAGASAPESLVREVIDALATLGPVTVTEHHTTQETVQFSLPKQVR